MDEYRVTINGVETTMLLDDEQAKQLNAEPVESKRRRSSNKARKSVDNKSDSNADAAE